MTMADNELAGWARNWHWNDCADDQPVDPSIYFRDMRMLKAFIEHCRRGTPGNRRDAEPVEANLRQRQLEHGKKRPEQNNPDGYPDEIPATPAGEEVRRTAIEECAKIAQSAREDDLDYAIKYPDERRKMEERAHRAGTIETAIRALSPSSNGKPDTRPEDWPYPTIDPTCAQDPK